MSPGARGAAELPFGAAAPIDSRGTTTPRSERIAATFPAWRERARTLLAAGVPPNAVHWTNAASGQGELPGLTEVSEEQAPAASNFGASRIEPSDSGARVPSAFLAIAEKVAHHRAEDRFALLYRVLWRLTHDEPELLRFSIDPDVARLTHYARSVGRDLHKMHAFVRFRAVVNDAGETTYVAWHRPDHPILPLAAPFFARRFAGMRWVILTDDESVAWDGSALRYLPGCPRSAAPRGDEVETLWRTYYASTFNPARIKLRAMRKELPVRYWDALPETALIRDLLREAPARLQSFAATQITGAEAYFPPGPAEDRTLDSLRAAAQRCRACGICARATQTVFGEGPARPRAIFVGEQPGDQEDRAGRVFVGPAGQLLDQALAEAGFARASLYLTNAVKHFKYEPQGAFRLHQRPNSGEIAACHPWLRAELEIVRAPVLVLLGATAAQSVLGRAVKLEGTRGEFFRTAFCARTLVTTHPAAILRTEAGAARTEAYARFVAELRLAAAAASAPEAAGSPPASAGAPGTLPARAPDLQ